MITGASRSAVVVMICVGLALVPRPVAGQSSTSAEDRGTPDESASSSDRRRQEVTGVRFTMEQHPTLHIGSLAEVSFRGRLESSVRTAAPDQGLDQAQAAWQSQRIELQGTVFDRVEFELSHEFSDAEEPERDAFVNLRIARAFELQAGRAKLPFGRDATTGRANLDFVYRSLVGRQLAPGRDVGLTAHGRLFGRVVSYEAGYFWRDGDNARAASMSGGRDAIASRLRIAPFASKKKSALATLEVGVAGARSALDQQLGLGGRTVLGQGVFFDRVYVNGTRLRRGLEAGWALGPVSVSGEYMSVSDERTGMGPAGEPLPSIRAAGWYLAGTWAPTGERKHGRLVPRRDFLRGGVGAIELAARVERFAFDAVGYPGTPLGFPATGSLSANAERATTLGITWYVNRYLKAQANVVMEEVDDPQRSPAPGADGRFTSTVFLFQFAM